MNKLQQQISNKLFTEYSCHLNLNGLNVHLSYSNMKILYSLFNTIIKQVNRTQIGEYLFKYFRQTSESLSNNHQQSEEAFFNIKFIRFVCNEICLYIVDDCFNVNVPLLNMHLKSFDTQTIKNSISHQTIQSEFQLDISYYNRFQSGFESFIESFIHRVLHLLYL